MRRIVSLILVIAGLIELITGIVLYIIPAGRVAYWSNYHLMGLDKHQWGNLHITVGFLVIVSAVIHVCYNWKPIVSYLRNKARKLVVFNVHSLVAIAICLYVVIGTLYKLPPMKMVLSVGEYFTEQGNARYGEPPYGHAELSSLKMFCSKMNLDYAGSVKLLADAGIADASGRGSIADIAAANGKRPQDIYDIIKPAGIHQDDDVMDLPASPMPGFGMKSLKDVCKTYGLPMKEVLDKLKASGMEAVPDDTIKEIAVNAGKNPMSVFEILKEVEGQ